MSDQVTRKQRRCSDTFMLSVIGRSIGSLPSGHDEDGLSRLSPSLTRFIDGAFAAKFVIKTF